MSGTLFSILDRRKSVSAREVADASGYSLRSVELFAQRGQLPGAFRVGRRGAWRFRRDAIEAWWATQAK